VYIDKRKCSQLIESLRQYRVKFDEKRQVSLGPLHDHTSHAADCVRYMAMGLRSTEKAAPLKYSNTGII
jgi:phage terminase large subunit